MNIQTHAFLTPKFLVSDPQGPGNHRFGTTDLMKQSNEWGPARGSPMKAIGQLGGHRAR